MPTNELLNICLNGDFTDVLGAELVTNGDFATGDFTGWTENTTPGTSIVGNACQFDHTGANLFLGQEFGATVGKTYQIEYEVTANTGVSSSQFALSFTSCFGAFDLNATIGKHKLNKEATKASSQDLLFLLRNSTEAGDTITLDNISVKEVLSPWIPGDEWTLDNTAANWLSQATDTALSQPTIGVYEGATYKVYAAISNTVLAASDTYVVVTIGGAGGTSYQFTEDQVWDASTPLYLQCGSSPSSGIEFVAVNGTAGDTMTIDAVAVIVEQMKPSTNDNAVFVSGNILVPAGATKVVNGDMELDSNWNDNGTPSVNERSSEQAHGGTYSRKFTTDTANWGIKSDTFSPTIGKTHLVSYWVYPIARASIRVIIEAGNGSTDAYNVDTSGLTLNAWNNITGTYIEPTGGANASIRFVSDIAAANTWYVDDVTLYELTSGPIDEYPWDSTTDYSSGAEPLGIYNGEKVYKSASTHADGAGGTTNWVIYTNGSVWIIAESFLTATEAFWFNGVGEGIIGPYINSGDLVTGTATVTYGPTDHSTATGSTGFKTDGTSESRITLKGPYNEVNTNRETQWALVSIIKPLAGNANTDRIISMETADGVGYFWTQTGTGTFNAMWTGTTAIDLDGTAEEDTIHNIMNISDIAANDSWLTVDGVDADSQADAAGLNAVDTTTITLGARTDALADQYAGVYGAQYYLDLTGVTVNATFKDDLKAAINTAALASNYEAHAVGAAMFAVDGGMTGAYWALNEASSGDVSSYYLLAYDITDGSAYETDFYGLVSASGVTGTSLGGASGGRYGGFLRPRYAGFYRNRYN